MSNLIKVGKITVAPGTLDATVMENVSEFLDENLKKYEVVVSEDAVKDAKKDMAELNKIKKSIKDVAKKAIDEYMEPVAVFKEKLKEIEEKITSTREFLGSQVQKYENKRKEEIREIIDNYISTVLNLDGHSDLIEKVNPNEFVKLSAVTASGKLAKATKELIDTKIKELVAEKEMEELRKQQEEMQKQLEKEKIKNEVIQEIKTEQLKQEPEPEKPKPTIKPKDDKVVYILTKTYEVLGKPGKTQEEIIKAIDTLERMGNLEPKIKLEIIK